MGIRPTDLRPPMPVRRSLGPTVLPLLLATGGCFAPDFDFGSSSLGWEPWRQLMELMAEPGRTLDGRTFVVAGRLETATYERIVVERDPAGGPTILAAARWVEHGSPRGTAPVATVWIDGIPHPLEPAGTSAGSDEPTSLGVHVLPIPLARAASKASCVRVEIGLDDGPPAWFEVDAGGRRVLGAVADGRSPVVAPAPGSGDPLRPDASHGAAPEG